MKHHSSEEPKPVPQDKPFNERYGMEIDGKLIPFKDLPEDINELKKLMKPKELDEILDWVYETLPRHNKTKEDIICKAKQAIKACFLEMVGEDNKILNLDSDIKTVNEYVRHKERTLGHNQAKEEIRDRIERGIG